MPLFDFKCHMCGAEWEDLASVAGPSPPCPDCTSHEVSRLQGIPYIGNVARQKIMSRGLRHGANSGQRTSVYIKKE